VGEPSQDTQYREAAAGYGPALERLARAYEFDPDRRRDLLQEIHLALWRSFALFDGRCSLRTWVYRVAHNTAVSYGIGRRRSGDRNLVSLEDVELTLGTRDGDEAAGRREALARVTELMQSLKPLDRQVILSYLEGMDAVSIGEITGLAAGNVATKIHRIKTVLAKRFNEGAQHA